MAGMSTAQRRLTEAEYLTAERLAETKSDYYDGEALPLSGSNRMRSLIAGAILAALAEQLRARPDEVYGNMRVKVGDTRLITYPSLVVVSNKPHFFDDEDDTLLNPTVLVEVLSDSTANYVRTLKVSEKSRWAEARL